MTPIHRKAQRRQRGFTLVELMISLLLGLLVIGAAGSMFFSNRKVYGSTEAISRIQENQRSAYEMLARDIREAGGNPCTRNIVNMLDTSKPGGAYYAGWQNGLSGTNNTGLNGSDEISLSNATAGAIMVTSNDGPSAEVGVTTNIGISSGDILMVCNSEVASVFQVTNTANNKLGHNSGEGVPGNLAKPFQITQEAFDASVGGANACGYCFLPISSQQCVNRPVSAGGTSCPRTMEPNTGPVQIVKPTAVRWFLQNNGRGGTSLYRQEISNGGATVGTSNEIAEGVTNLQITYKVGDAATYVDASAGLDWGRVTAVHVNMVFRASQGTLTKSDTEGTDNAVITRVLNDYILLRNHQEIQ